MKRSQGIVYLLLLSALTVNSVFVWRYFQSQETQTQRLADMARKLVDLQTHITAMSTSAEYEYPALQQANIPIEDLSIEIHSLIDAELQPLVEQQRELVQVLLQTQSNQPYRKSNAVPLADYVDSDEEIRAYEQSAALLDELITTHTINAEDSMRLQRLGRRLSENSRGELRDRLVKAINEQQLAVSSDFVPPF